MPTSSQGSAGLSTDGGPNVTWGLIGRDESERPGGSPPYVADHPEEVVRNVVGAMECRDAEKMRQFLALSKSILMAMCRECGVASSGTNLYRAMELTAIGASPGDPLLR